MKLIYCGFLQPKDLRLCWDVFDKQGFTFYRTTYGNLLHCIKTTDKKKSWAISYNVKLNLMEKIFGWKNKRKKCKFAIAKEKKQNE